MPKKQWSIVQNITDESFKVSMKRSMEIKYTSENVRLKTMEW